MDLLIDEISEAAYEAIEQAASEAARAAMLASLEREAAAYRETALQRADALHWRLEAESYFKALNDEKKKSRRKAVLTGIICLVSGFVIGSVTINAIGGK